MIKNKIILTLIIGSLFSPLFAVNAVENTNKKVAPTTTNNTVAEKAKPELTEAQKVERGSIEIRTMLLNKKIDERKNEKKITLSAKSKNVILPLMAKIYKNLDEKVKKIEAIDLKISTRIEILKKEGKDVSKIEAQYNIAKLELTRAKAGVLAASTLSVKQIMAGTSKGVIRDLVKETENNIKNAGDAYRKMLPMFAQLEGNNSIKN